MTYQVLARKWRPQTFSQMVGQEHVVRALTNAIDKDRLHHAYLFTGTRGVGKTTIARIIAKSLNCENGLTSSPCLACDTCLAIERGDFVDLIEIDAASRTKVEDTREMLDNVMYRPTVGRYKIYLIDEVHMLSGHSFNALLKTLEEPPSYVVFILATTDPHKIPATVLSRCLKFTLKHLLAEQIAAFLETVCAKETVGFEPFALHLLAEAASGSMRDALSLLDQAIAFSDENITASAVRRMLGVVGEEVIAKLLYLLYLNDGEALLLFSRELAHNGCDFQRLTDELIDALYQISVNQCVGQTESQCQRLIELAALFSKEDVQLYYQMAINGKAQIGLMPSLSKGFDMLMLRMLCFRPVESGDIRPPEETKAQKAPQAAPNAYVAPVKSAVQPVERTPQVATDKPLKKPKEVKAPDSAQSKPVTPSLRVDTSALSDEAWHEIVSSLKLSGMAKTVLGQCVLVEKQGATIKLGLKSSHETLLTKPIIERIEQALKEHFSEPVKLSFSNDEGGGETPAAIGEAKRRETFEGAKDELSRDAALNKIIETFDAKIDEASVKLLDDVT